MRRLLSFVSLSFLLFLFLSGIGEAKGFNEFLEKGIKTLDQKIVESRTRPPEPPVPPQNRPPYVPSNPNPPNGAKDVGTSSVNLSWIGGDPDGDRVTYVVEVYNGQEFSSSSTNVTNVTISSLKGSTSYLWKVTARDEKGSTTKGPLWSFTTIPQPEEWKVVKNGVVDEFRLLQRREYVNVNVEKGVYLLIDTLGIQKNQEEIIPIGSSTFTFIVPPGEEWRWALLAPVHIQAVLEKKENKLYLIWYRRPAENEGDNFYERYFQTSNDEGKTWTKQRLSEFEGSWPHTYGPIEHILFFQNPDVIQYVWNDTAGNSFGPTYAGIFIYSSYDNGVNWNAQFILNYEDYDSAYITGIIHGRQIIQITYDESNILVKAKMVPKDGGPPYFYLSSNDKGRTWSLERKDE